MKSNLSWFHIRASYRRDTSIESATGRCDAEKLATHSRLENRTSTAMNGSLEGFLGSTLRGVWGYSLKDAFCSAGTSCKVCQDPSRCGYGVIFEPVSEEWKRMGFQNPPPPFIIEEFYQPRWENHLTIDLKIFTDRVDFLGILIALRKMGEWGLGKGRIPYEFLSAYDVNTGQVLSDRINTILCQPGSMDLQTYWNQQSAEKLDTRRFILHAITPVRYRLDDVEENNCLQDLGKLILIRFQNMLTLYGKLDLADLPEEDSLYYEPIWTESVEWDRYSNRQKKKIHQSGVIGTYQVEVDDYRWIPILYSLPILYLGKGCNFGFGKIEVVASRVEQ